MFYKFENICSYKKLFIEFTFLFGTFSIVVRVGVGGGGGGVFCLFEIVK